MRIISISKMPSGHFTAAGGYLDHGDAAALFPVERLSATVHRARDAHLALGRADGDDVVVVRPTGLASSYFLTQRPLTAIEVASLDENVVVRLGASAGLDLDTFELVQIGRSRSMPENHSLLEFSG